MKKTNHILFVFFTLLISSTVFSEENSDSTMKNVLVIEKQSIFEGSEKDLCKIRTKNDSKNIQFIYRPKITDISFQISKSAHENYSVITEKKLDNVLAQKAIPLRPNCAIEINLGSIVREHTEKELDLKKFYNDFKTSTLWKIFQQQPLSLSKFETIHSTSEVITKKEHSKNALVNIILEPSAESYVLGHIIPITVRITNSGLFPVKLFNLFHPYKNYFRLIKAYEKPDNKLVERPHIISKATPENRSVHWLTLMPNESLLVYIDASGEFHKSGRYFVTIEYNRYILICPPDKKPYYSDQRNWLSEKIEMSIVEE